MYLCHFGEGIVIHPDMGITKAHNTIPCESRISVNRILATKMFLQRILQKAIGETPSLHDGQGE
jgi:hypothetical protein